MSRSNQLYAALAERGGTVPNQDEWRELFQSCGYRRACGFFGGRMPSMVRLADGSRELTPEGWRRARR